MQSNGKKPVKDISKKVLVPMKDKTPVKETVSDTGNDVACESVDRRDHKDIPKRDKMPSKGKKPVKDISKKKQ